MDDPEETICAMCGRLVTAGSGYVVKIEVYADPTIPPTTGDALATIDFDAALRDVLAEASQRSAADLQDGVYRRFAFHLCGRCQRRYLENPLPPV